MKLEVEVSDDMRDAIIIATLKMHLDMERDYKPINDEDRELQKDIIVALEVSLEYFGG